MFLCEWIKYLISFLSTCNESSLWFCSVLLARLYAETRLLDWEGFVQFVDLKRGVEKGGIS